MAKLWNGPAIGGMTLSTILSKEFEMAVVVRVTCRAVERGFLRRNGLMRRRTFANPLYQLPTNRQILTIYLAVI